LDFCRGGIHFSGAVNGELASELGDSYEKIVRHKTTCLRQNLLEAIIATENVRVDFTVKGDLSKTEQKDESSQPKESSKSKTSTKK